MVYRLLDIKARLDNPVREGGTEATQPLQTGGRFQLEVLFCIHIKE